MFNLGNGSASVSHQAGSLEGGGFGDLAVGLDFGSNQRTTAKIESAPKFQNLDFSGIFSDAFSSKPVEHAKFGGGFVPPQANTINPGGRQVGGGDMPPVGNIGNAITTPIGNAPLRPEMPLVGLNAPPVPIPPSGDAGSMAPVFAYQDSLLSHAASGTSGMNITFTRTAPPVPAPEPVPQSSAPDLSLSEPIVPIPPPLDAAVLPEIAVAHPPVVIPEAGKTPVDAAAKFPTASVDDLAGLVPISYQASDLVVGGLGAPEDLLLAQAAQPTDSIIRPPELGSSAFIVGTGLPVTGALKNLLDTLGVKDPLAALFFGSNEFGRLANGQLPNPTAFFGIPVVGPAANATALTGLVSGLVGEAPNLDLLSAALIRQVAELNELASNPAFGKLLPARSAITPSIVVTEPSGELISNGLMGRFEPNELGAGLSIKIGDDLLVFVNARALLESEGGTRRISFGAVRLNVDVGGVPTVMGVGSTMLLTPGEGAWQMETRDGRRQPVPEAVSLILDALMGTKTPIAANAPGFQEFLLEMGLTEQQIAAAANFATGPVGTVISEGLRGGAALGAVLSGNAAAGLLIGGAYAVEKAGQLGEWGHNRIIDAGVNRGDFSPIRIIEHALSNPLSPAELVHVAEYVSRVTRAAGEKGVVELGDMRNQWQNVLTTPEARSGNPVALEQAKIVAEILNGHFGAADFRTRQLTGEGLPNFDGTFNGLGDAAIFAPGAAPRTDFRPQ